jgi:hypothetical protein
LSLCKQLSYLTWFVDLVVSSLTSPWSSGGCRLYKRKPFMMSRGSSAVPTEKIGPLTRELRPTCEQPNFLSLLGTGSFMMSSLCSRSCHGSPRGIHSCGERRRAPWSTLQPREPTVLLPKLVALAVLMI